MFKVELNFKLISSLVSLLILILLFFPETSLDTSRAVLKDSIYSVYLYRLYGLCLSDWIIVLLLLLVFLIAIRRNSIHIGIMKPIIMIYVLYLFVGLFYNVTVALDVHSFLYDIKVSLYLFVPFLTLSILPNEYKAKFDTKTLNMAILFVIVGAIYDAFYTSYTGGYEYSSHLGMPLILEILPIPLLLGAGFSLVHSKKYLVLAIYEFLSSANRANLGSVFWGGLSIAWFFILQLKVKFRPKVLIMMFGYYFIVVCLPLLVMFVFSDLVGVKKGGMEVRRGEVINFIENSTINIPIVIGKGLGSTWKEVLIDESASVYSQGHLLNSDNNFIWHNTLAGSFYKFGILGSMFLIFYLSTISVKLYSVSRMTNNKIGMFIAFTIPAFVMVNVNGPGVLKGALISSLLLYGADQILRKQSVCSFGKSK